MCGRIFSSLRGERVMEIANTNNRGSNFSSNNYARSFNVPPTHNLAAIVHKSCNVETSNEEQTENEVDEDLSSVDIAKANSNRKVVVFKWGWLGSYVINARGEELREKPMF